ncbi:MAG: hypothetical protein AB7G06_05505 [Bdellovibrionales bacterium]
MTVVYHSLSGGADISAAELKTRLLAVDGAEGRFDFAKDTLPLRTDIGGDASLYDAVLNDPAKSSYGSGMEWIPVLGLGGRSGFDGRALWVETVRRQLQPVLDDMGLRMTQMVAFIRPLGAGPQLALTGRTHVDDEWFQHQKIGLLLNLAPPEALRAAGLPEDAYAMRHATLEGVTFGDVGDLTLEEYTSPDVQAKVGPGRYVFQPGVWNVFDYAMPHEAGTPPPVDRAVLDALGYGGAKAVTISVQCVPV